MNAGAKILRDFANPLLYWYSILEVFFDAFDLRRKEMGDSEPKAKNGCWEQIIF
jgi:hypothetical protein